MKHILLIIITIGYAITAKAQSDCGTVTDVDGNTYNTVQIGTQCWLKENLKTAHYRDGSPVLNGNDSVTWSNIYLNNTKTGTWCDYADSLANDTLYGKLYNWYAFTDPRGLCPLGWHAPDSAEWWKVINYEGGRMLAGDSLKSVILWRTVTTPGSETNSSGFTALPAGERAEYSIYMLVRETAHFWSTTPNDTTRAISFNLAYHDPSIFIDNDLDELGAGMSCRCVKDSGTTGLQKNDDNPIYQIVAYPNPFSNQIRLDGLQPGLTYTATLTDITGKIIGEQKLSGSVAHITIATSLSQGMYLLQISDGSTSRTLKLVKQ